MSTILVKQLQVGDVFTAPKNMNVAGFPVMKGTKIRVFTSDFDNDGSWFANVAIQGLFTAMPIYMYENDYTAEEFQSFRDSL